MYNLNGYELSLDVEILKKYSILVGEELNGHVLNHSIEWMGLVKTESTSFEEAIKKVGLEQLSNLIMEQINEELNVFHVRDN